MNLETKFNIGDKVYVNYGHPVHSVGVTGVLSTVEDIEIYVTKTETVIGYILKKENGEQLADGYMFGESYLVKV